VQSSKKPAAADAPRTTWDDNEDSRRRQLREDAARPLAENLAEGLALSEFLSTFTGAARSR
jgi:LAS superfamily LD-carboxypeptidase LdcB